MYITEGKEIAVAKTRIRLARPIDAKLLERLSTETFYQTFAGQDCNKQVASYMASAFSEDQIYSELRDPKSLFILSFVAQEPVGYAKLRKDKKPGACLKGKAIEIHRLYVLQQMIGKKVGKALMEACLSIAKREGYDVIWLGVWKENVRAIEFYKQWGFEIFKKCSFKLGTDKQTDYLMKKELISYNA